LQMQTAQRRSKRPVAMLICVAASSDSIEVELKVTGMSCECCVEGVQGALEKLENLVSKVEVDLDSGKATVQVKVGTMAAAVEALPSLVAAVEKAGFEAEPLIE
jgi:copper chaperone CopZ